MVVDATMTKKIYCPIPDCSMPLEQDEDVANDGIEITFATCPSCQKDICAR